MNKMKTGHKSTEKDTALFESRLQNRLTIAVDLIREFGPKKFMGKILPWHFSRKYTFYSMDLPSLQEASLLSVPPIKPPGLSDFRLELATESDVAHIMAARPHFYSQEQIRIRIQAGHMCFIGWIKDEPVHLRWHFIRSLYLPYLKRTLRIGAQEVWADEGYTKPGYRRSGIFAFAGALITQALAEMNYQRLSCAFASWNITPRRIDEERGMKPVGEIIYRKYFGHHIYSSSGRIREYAGEIIEIEGETLQDTNQQL